jgi:hypothetical protein
MSVFLARTLLRDPAASVCGGEEVAYVRDLSDRVHVAVCAVVVVGQREANNAYLIRVKKEGLGDGGKRSVVCVRGYPIVGRRLRVCLS